MLLLSQTHSLMSVILRQETVMSNSSHQSWLDSDSLTNSKWHSTSTIHASLRCLTITVSKQGSWKHLRWFCSTFQDLVWCVEVQVYNTVNATFTAHCWTLYNIFCHFASNVSVVTNSNVLQMSVISNCLVIIQRSSKNLSHQVFAFPWLSRT